MDTTSIIEIVAVVLALYFFIKFIVSPVIRIIIGVVIILVLIYLLQQFFSFDLTKIAGPYAKYLELNNFGINLNWILAPANYYINEIKSFISYIWGNIPKSLNQ